MESDVPNYIFTRSLRAFVLYFSPAFDTCENLG